MKRRATQADLNGLAAQLLLVVVAAIIGTLLGVFVADTALGAPADVCPEEGKVESVVDGDLDDIVLEEGTKVCVFGASVQVVVVADGSSTLRDLLGLDKNVSHYTVLESPTTTTTTSIPETTTTTVPPTTTVPKTTTTTIEDETSSTSLPDNTTTTSTPEETTTTSSDGTTTSMSPTPNELPMTGFSELIAWAILGLILLSIGGLIVSTMRSEQ